MECVNSSTNDDDVIRQMRPSCFNGPLLPGGDRSALTSAAVVPDLNGGAAELTASDGGTADYPEGSRTEAGSQVPSIMYGPVTQGKLWCY